MGTENQKIEDEIEEEIKDDVDNLEIEEDEEVEETTESENEEDNLGGQEKKPHFERKQHSMSVAKAQAEKKKAAEKAYAKAAEEFRQEKERLTFEYDERIKKLSQKEDSSEVSERLKNLSEKYNLDVEAAKELLDVFKGSIKLPDLSKYDQIVKEQEEKAEKLKYSSEFDDVVAPLIIQEYPQATQEFIREVKERMELLAFSEDFHNYRLEDIYLVKKRDFEFKNGYTAESSRGSFTDTEKFKKLTDEEEIELSDIDPDRYKKYLKWLSSQESRFID